MKLKEASKIAEAVKTIECLNIEIKELNQIAKSIADGSTKNYLELKIEAPQEQKVKFNEDGSLISSAHEGGSGIPSHLRVVPLSQIFDHLDILVE